MCGISGIVGPVWETAALEAMVRVQEHRGPDDAGLHTNPARTVGLGHNRLSILDLSAAGHQPMSDRGGRYQLVFNGEIYNYLELRKELDDHPYQSRTDTEVVIAAYERWGEKCLDRFVGMFAFALWDEKEQKLFCARDRFGVKPFHWARRSGGGFIFASEIKAIHAAGIERRPNPLIWATYLASGMYDHSEQTFWAGVHSLPPGSALTWRPSAGMEIRQWYDPADAVSGLGLDERPDAAVGEEFLALLEESVALRFRSDVPVGVCLSGGLDSSLLLALVHRLQGLDSNLKTFTFYCGDPAYDETPWVEQMLAGTRHPALFCRLDAADVPELAEQVQWHQDEPFGGLPTLGMARVHDRAREEGVVVLLDGNGMDEGWAGYDYYARADSVRTSAGPVQGSRSAATRPDCLVAEVAASAEVFVPQRPFGEPLRDLQYRDLRHAKIPRAMRFADRVSMQYSRELREPFLDHRIVELGVRQPVGRKIRDGKGKWLPRQVASRLLPEGVFETPKRPVQTPQREWLRGPLAPWADALIERAIGRFGGEWLDSRAVRSAWREFRHGDADNSFYVWQWLSLGLLLGD